MTKRMRIMYGSATKNRTKSAAETLAFGLVVCGSISVKPFAQQHAINPRDPWGLAL